jgi:hypothetical protein
MLITFILLIVDRIELLLFFPTSLICHIIASYSNLTINSRNDWCTANSMRPDPAKMLFHATITHVSSIKDLGVFFDSKLHFHNHVSYVFSECIKLLDLIRSITYSFSSLECLYVLYFTLVRSKLECASVVWNTITSTDANKLEYIQQMFTPVCFYHFVPHVPYTYTVALEELGLHFYIKGDFTLILFFLVQIYNGLKSCTSHFENVNLYVPPSTLREFSLFCACPNKHCLSARCTFAANMIGKDLDIFALGTVYLNCIYVLNCK